MNAKETIMARIRAATTDVTEPDPATDVAIDWSYGTPTPMGEVVERFVERTADYEATVVQCEAAALPQEVARGLRETGAGCVVVPAGVDAAWVQAIEEAGLRVEGDDPPRSAAELNQIDAVVTASAVGIAETGTIVLDHGPAQGRRALTLVPDRHVCVVRADQIVSDVPEGIARVAPAIRAGRPVTMISGPSATSDIELDRVEGVHGPRTLWVIVVR